MEAKELVVSGAQWRVGTGENIDIVGQPWLDDVRPYIETVSPSLDNNKVVSLMSMNHNSWDEEIISDLFNERDQECIRRTKMGGHRERDVIYWSLEKHGNYSVRSAYRWLQAQKSYWNPSDNHSYWRKIWCIKAPAKILNLLTAYLQ